VHWWPNHFGVAKVFEDITPILLSVGFYIRYHEAIQTVIPEYGSGWKSKMVISNLAEHQGYTYFSVIAQSPDGRMIKKRLPLEAYLSVVAATNFKQRIRKMLEYYYADRNNYAVAGTPNRLEYDQDFSLSLVMAPRNVKPIAHLYKSQVINSLNI